MIANVKAIGEGHGGVKIELPATPEASPVFVGSTAFKDAHDWLKSKGFVWCKGSRGVWHSMRRKL